MSDEVLEAMHEAAKQGPANSPPNMRRVLRAALEAAGVTTYTPRAIMGITTDYRARHGPDKWERDADKGAEALDRLLRAANLSERGRDEG